MYQSVIRDPGGNETVRVISSAAIVNGSILLVPADTVALFVCNGQVSEPYTAGRWEINTGVSPFFVHFRNIMTAGDPGITCQVFYVNVCKENWKSGGTGDMIFEEKRFHISMHARAAYTMRYIIANPRAFVSQLVGMHNNSFSEEDIQPAIDAMLLPSIKEAVVNYISNSSIHALQSQLTAIGNDVQNGLRSILSGYGISLRAVSITTINVSEADVARLNELETKYAKGIMKTDIEVDNIKRVYGNVENRTLTEIATGSVRGSANRAARGNDRSAGIAGYMASLPVQLAVANRVMDQMSGPINNMMDRSGLGNSRNNRPVPPDLPRSYKTCPNCHRQIDDGDPFCRYCGHQF